MPVNLAPRTARRARRLTSEEAHAWVRSLRLRNPLAKAVLVALTFYVDGDGVCFVSLEQLAEDVEVSVDTVRRRLAWLEAIGAIARREQYIDANGCRTSENRGRRTTDQIRLWLSTTPDEIEANIDLVAQGGEIDAIEYDGRDGDADVSDCLQQAEREPDANDGLEVSQPSHSGEGLILKPEPKPEDSPPSPPPGGSQDDLSWKAFERAWAEPIAKLSTVQDIWTTFAPADRSTAVKAAAGYWAWRKAEKRPPSAISARNFLRERGGWAQWLSYSPGSSKAGLLGVELEGSPAWRARCTIAKIAGRPAPVALDLREGRGNHVAPLAAEYLELDRYADDDPADWEFLDQKDGRCLAWCDFLRIEARPITLGTRPHEYNGRRYDDWPIKRTGLRVPCPWPPSYGSDEVPL